MKELVSSQLSKTIGQYEQRKEKENVNIEQKHIIPWSRVIFGLYQNLRLSLSNLTCGYLTTSGNNSEK